MVINFLSSSGLTIMQFVVSLILARILTPAEIGVYSMTVMFVNFAHVFRDFGVSAYLQREPDLNTDKLRSAIGVLFSSTWLIATILLFASPAIGRWFNEPAITPVMRVLAIGFFFIPFGSITNAMLARNFEAGKEAFAVSIGMVFFCVSCVTFAKMGFGSMSLAYANLINIIVGAIAYIPMRPKNLPWLPSFKHWRSVAHFGAGSLVSSCVGAMNVAICDILLGKLGTARQVGLLSRANSTVTIFSYVAGSAVSYGALSYLAQMYHRGESLVPVLRRATTMLTGVGWTALMLSAVLGRDVVLALYGEKWLDCIPAIVPLSVCGAINMMFHYVPFAVTSIGRPYLSAMPSIVSLVARIAFGLALFTGNLSQYAWALAAATAITAPVIASQQKRYLGYAFPAMMRDLIPSGIVAIVTGAAGYVLATLLPASMHPIPRLLIMMVPLAAVWYGMLRATHHELVGEVHRMFATIRSKLMPVGQNV